MAHPLATSVVIMPGPHASRRAAPARSDLHNEEVEPKDPLVCGSKEPDEDRT